MHGKMINVTPEQDVAGAIRIEAGPVRRQAVATEALLSEEVTAGHYQVGRPDSMGKPIVLGEPMNYIDWKGAEVAWYVYRHDGERYQPAGVEASEEAAVQAAAALSREG